MRISKCTVDKQLRGLLKSISPHLSAQRTAHNIQLQRYSSQLVLLEGVTVLRRLKLLQDTLNGHWSARVVAFDLVIDVWLLASNSA